MIESFEETTPKAITPEILVFCQAITDTQPIFLSPKPNPWSRMQFCFQNVLWMCRCFGGNLLMGRLVWEIEGHLYTAEAHAVWINPSGDYVDVTMPVNGEERVLFLPVPREIYRHSTPPGARMAKSQVGRNMAVRANLRDKEKRIEMEKAKERDLWISWYCAPSAEEYKINNRILPRYQTCPCGSGAANYICHPKIMENALEHDERALGILEKIRRAHVEWWESYEKNGLPPQTPPVPEDGSMPF